MILDHETAYSIEQEVTGETTSTNVVYLGPENYVGTASGYDYLPIALSVAEVFAPSGDANTLTVELESSPLEDFSSGVVTSGSSKLTNEQLRRRGKLPLQVAISTQVHSYTRLKFVPDGANFTSGAITAMVAASTQTNN